MGFMLPYRESPADKVRCLTARKEAIEAEIEAQNSILKANSSTLNTPLVDADGFPRGDIDVWAVRHARVRIIELRNDFSAVMDEMMTALQGVYESPPDQRQASQEVLEGSSTDQLQPFAKVDGVAPSSPAATAGLLRGDLVLAFGSLRGGSFSASSLQPLAALVSSQENREIPVKVSRSGETHNLTLIPRSGWGGRGLLGCHIVPYVSQ